MDKFDVELMALGFDVAVEGGDGIEESNDWLEVGLHWLETAVVSFMP